MAIYPDTIVKDGIILDLVTHEELPSYQGLCLANLAGCWAVMNTWLTSEGREWDLVHFGSSLSSTEIAKYVKDRGSMSK